MPAPDETESIVLIDDHLSVAEGLCCALQPHLKHFSVRAIPIEPDVADRLIDLQPRVAVVDWSFEENERPAHVENGVDLIHSVAPRLPNTRWVLYTGFLRPYILKQALTVGVLACVSKSSNIKELVSAITAAGDGKVYFCSRTQKAFPSIAAEVRCNETEIQILRHIHAGMEAKAIAASIGLTVKSVHNYLAKLRRKLRARSMVDLARRAEERGIVPPERRH